MGWSEARSLGEKQVMGERVYLTPCLSLMLCVFFFQAEDGIRDRTVTGVQTCALPILRSRIRLSSFVLGCCLYPSELAVRSRATSATSASKVSLKAGWTKSFQPDLCFCGTVTG